MMARAGSHRLSSSIRRVMTRSLALAAVAALTLGACSGAGDGSSAEGGGDGAAELTVWFNRDYAVPPDKFETFHEEYPDINVTYDVRPDDNILPTLVQMREAGEELPDIIQDDTAVIPGYVQADLLHPLDDLVARWEEEDPESYERLYPVVWEQGTFDNQIYQMALIANYDLLYYNVGWLEEAGVEPPFASWEEVYEVSQTLKEARPDSHPFTIQGDPRDGVTALLNQMVTSGVPFDGAVPELTSEEGQYLIGWYQKMVAEGLISPEAVAWGEDEARGAFIGKRTALIIEGLNTAADFTETPNYDFGTDWATTLLPISTTEDAEEGDYFVVPRGFSIVNGTEHPYEASLAMRYLADTEQAVGATVIGSSPPRQVEALTDSPELDEFLPHFSQDMRPAYLEGIPNPPSSRFAEIEQVLGEMLNGLVAGDDTPPAELAEQYQAQLDELKE
jgi:ABC-type glycerol-3-phosphate transport system substrate-binding protein